MLLQPLVASSRCTLHQPEIFDGATHLADLRVSRLPVGGLPVYAGADKTASSLCAFYAK